MSVIFANFFLSGLPLYGFRIPVCCLSLQVTDILLINVQLRLFTRNVSVQYFKLLAETKYTFVSRVKNIYTYRHTVYSSPEVYWEELTRVGPGYGAKATAIGKTHCEEENV